MVSLIGCIVPRTIVYAKAVRARPPKAPGNFDRLPASATFETSASVDDVLAAGRRAVGRARVDVIRPAGMPGDGRPMSERCGPSRGTCVRSAT